MRAYALSKAVWWHVEAEGAHADGFVSAWPRMQTRYAHTWMHAAVQACACNKLNSAPQHALERQALGPLKFLAGILLPNAVSCFVADSTAPPKLQSMQASKANHFQVTLLQGVEDPACKIEEVWRPLRIESTKIALQTQLGR